MVLVDSSVLIDLLSRDPTWRKWSKQQFASATLLRGGVCINPIIYA